MRNDEIQRLADEEAKLELLLKAVREKKRAALQSKARSKTAPSPTRPLRDIVIEALADAMTPLNSLLLASVIRPLQDREIPSTRFGTLSIDETKSFDSSRHRPVYLCHCITHDRGDAVKRFWARSDWPLAERIIGPMSGRILFLKGAAWAIGLAKAAEEGKVVAAKPELLNYVAADQARDVGIVVERGKFPFGEWLKAIAVSIERYERDDREIREAAAVALSERLPERALLFGAPPGFVSLPGSHKDWRSARDDR